MKNVVIAVLLVAAVAFAGLYVSQKHKLGEAEAANAGLRQSLSEMEGRVAEQEKQTTKLQTRLKDTRAKAVAKAEEVSHLEQALTNSVKTNAKASNPFGEMFKSKEMKELVKTQQKVALGGIIEKNYGAFFTGLQLTPEQTAGLKELIVKKSLPSH